MISVNDFKTGVTVDIDGVAYQVVEFQHVKPGKGAAFVRAKLKNLVTGGSVEKTFRGGEKIPRAHLDKKEMQYLYHDGQDYVFMDTASFDQQPISAETIGDNIKWLQENMLIQIVVFQGQIIGVELPNFIEMEIVDCEPAVKGDTATGASKQATVETGARVMVPLFVEQGDHIRIDTRTGEYMERV